ncbi:putative glutathione S-transferase [Xylariomycetidae sp. FL2044]|nr:putative glutathione S-transferase [Xylariomycetidae sp. FL2044]
MTPPALTVHHLRVSQSERIPWLCEELGIPYTLTIHERAPIFSPQSIKDLNPLGQAPVIQDRGHGDGDGDGDGDGAGKGDLPLTTTLAESAACVEYIIHRHGGGRLALAPSHRDYADYVYWFHLANGTLQPHVLLMLQMSRVAAGAGPAAGNFAASLGERFGRMLALVDARLRAKPWLAGDAFTAADIMTVFTFTTMRAFYPFELGGYDGILVWLRRVTAREGYQRARAKADPELELMIEGEAPTPFVERLKAAGKL